MTIELGIRRGTGYQRQLGFIWFYGIYIFFFTVLTGCIAVPVPVEQTVLEGQRFSDSDIEFVEAGTTNRGDVIGKLGPATIWLPSQNTLVYGLREVTGTGMVWFMGAPGGSAGGLVAGEAREAVFFVLDSDDTVTDWGRTPVERGKTWLEALLEWSRAEGLSLPQPKGKFLEELPVSPEESLVYFYRPRDFQHYLPFGPAARRLALGAVDFVNIYRNAELVGQLRWKSYMVVRVSPGEREFVLDPDTDDVGNPELYLTASFRLTVEPQTTRYIEVGVEAGRGAIKPILVERSHDEAMAFLAELPESW